MAGSEVVSTRVEDGVALITLGGPGRIFFDLEMSDALLEAMTAFAADDAVVDVRDVHYAVDGRTIFSNLNIKARRGRITPTSSSTSYWTAATARKSPRPSCTRRPTPPRWR